METKPRQRRLRQVKCQNSKRPKMLMKKLWARLNQSSLKSAKKSVRPRTSRSKRVSLRRMARPMVTKRKVKVTKRKRKSPSSLTIQMTSMTKVAMTTPLMTTSTLLTMRMSCRLVKTMTSTWRPTLSGGRRILMKASSLLEVPRRTILAQSCQRMTTMKTETTTMMKRMPERQVCELYSC